MVCASLIKFHKVLDKAILYNCSDVHFTSKRAVFSRRKNKLEIFCNEIFTKEELATVLYNILNENQQAKFAEDRVIDCAYNYHQRRFRMNVYAISSGISIAMRLIGKDILDINSFIYADTLKRCIGEENSARGLILICGATGAGKSTTLASMVDYLNKTSAKHIITLEDPVEYVFKDEKSLIHQREYGNDFKNFSQAVKMAMRQDPDVLMIGEIRDVETMKATLSSAETGHLVLGTLHASSAVEALMRMESFFPLAELSSVRTQIANSLNSIIVQRLFPFRMGMDSENCDLICAMEILTANTAVKNIIRQGYFEQLNSQIQLHKKSGMHLMKDTIVDLVQRQLIDKKYLSTYASK